jgi:putative ABC transport system permease protein
MRRTFQYALKSAWRARRFSAGVIALVCVSMGSAIAVLSVAYGVLLKALPYPDAEDIVGISAANSLKGLAHMPGAVPEIDDLSSLTDTFLAVSGYRTEVMTYTTPERSSLFHAALVTPSFFDIFTTPLALGRSPDRVNNSPECVISMRVWQTVFASDPTVLGRPVRLNDATYTVVGVASTDLSFPEPNLDVWVTFIPTVEQMADRRSRFIRLVGRLRPEIRADVASIRVRALSSRLAAEFPSEKDWVLSIHSLKEQMTASMRRPLILASLSAGLLALIGIASLAVLFYARSAARTSDMWVRLAIGATQANIVAEHAIEGAILGLCGGVAGAFLSRLLMFALAHFSVGEIPRLQDALSVAWIAPWGVAVCVIIEMLLCGLACLFSLAGASVTPVSIRKAGKRARLLQVGLMATELAFGVALLYASLLMLRSFAKVNDVHPGFRVSDTAFVSIAMTGTYRDDHARQLYLEQILDTVRGNGIAARAAFVNSVPLANGMDLALVRLPDKPDAGDVVSPLVSVTQDYFAVMEIPILSGRAFVQSDYASSSAVIISDQFARRYWPNESPIGKTIALFGKRMSVVGISGDVLQDGLETEPRLCIYQPRFPFPAARMVFRERRGRLAQLKDVQRAVAEVDPSQPVQSAEALSDVLWALTGARRLLTLTMTLFTMTAIALTTGTLYGVVAYLSRRRRRELCIRIALGATPRQIAATTLRDAMIAAAGGFAFGVWLLFTFRSSIRNELFQVRMWDWSTVSITLLVLTTAFSIACFFPIREAVNTPVTEVFRDS